MNSTVSTRLTHEASRSIAWDDITTGYVAIGDRLEFPARVVLFQNDTDEKLWISLDGVTDGFFLRSGQDFVLDVATNQTQGRGLFMPVGDYIYTKQLGAPSRGNLYVCVMYGED